MGDNNYNIVNDVFDISKIMVNDNLERAFFRFLNDEHILWTQLGSNLNRIYIYQLEKNREKIINKFPELKNK